MESVSTLFQAELEKLEATYQWTLTEAPVAALSAFCKASVKTPLLSVGSGGSLTVAALATLLHQAHGMPAKHITPMELFASGACIPQSSLFFPSAGGKNMDVMNAAEFSAQRSPKSMLAMCGCQGSPLAMMTGAHAFASALEFDIPTGKDGFLATVSLIAFSAILMRGYIEALGGPWTMPSADRLFSKSPAAVPTTMFQKETWLILYGSWGLPVMLDAESKLTESTLMSVRPIDYRNFSHGHYHWLAQHPETTGVLALITPFEKDLAELTLSQLPPECAQHRLVTAEAGPGGTLDLMIQLICLVEALGKARGWDPSRMAVPEFAKKLQQLAYTVPGN